MSLPAGAAVNGEEAMVTVLFIDLRDFTRFADSATAREAIALLNEFFGVVAPVLESHGGHANKSEATRCMLTRADELVPRGTLELKGKPQPVAAYAPRAAR